MNLNAFFMKFLVNASKLYKHIVKALENGAAEYETIIDLTGYDSSGRLSDYLSDLSKGGFITRDFTYSLKSGKAGRISQFRLSDNYLRFYLKYIEPRFDLIEKGRFEKVSISSLPGWETIMGYQFENLVLGNRDYILKILNLRFEDIIADNPYLQRQTKRKKGCQVDYLIQTKYNNLYLCEIKFSRHPISSKVIEEVQEKIQRLAVPKGLAILPILIHVNGVHESVEESDFFYKIIDFGSVLQEVS